jgi:hypothetical protein
MKHNYFLRYTIELPTKKGAVVQEEELVSRRVNMISILVILALDAIFFWWPWLLLPELEWVSLCNSMLTSLMYTAAVLTHHHLAGDFWCFCWPSSMQWANKILLGLFIRARVKISNPDFD